MTAGLTLWVAAVIALVYITRPADEWAVRAASRVQPMTVFFLMAAALPAAATMEPIKGFLLLLAAALSVHLAHDLLNRWKGGLTRPGMIAAGLAIAGLIAILLR